MGVWEWPSDVERLNGILAADLVFTVAGGPGAVPAGFGSRAGPAQTLTWGVLLVRSQGGDERRAASPLPLPPSRRDGLLALSTCLAECAMALGLGAAACVPAACAPRGAARSAP